MDIPYYFRPWFHGYNGLLTNYDNAYFLHHELDNIKHFLTISAWRGPSILVLILNGNSDIVVHVQSDLSYLIF